MNVGELKTKLAEYPDDMEVLYRFCSDYERMDADDLETVSAVEKTNGYWMRSHETMSAENKAREKTYLLFPGN